MFDSLFYTRGRTTGAIVADPYENPAAALVHEGFHHQQYGCGAGPSATTGLARALVTELTEVMTYSLSVTVPFYRYMLTAGGRNAWTARGQFLNARQFGWNWTGIEHCEKTGSDTPTGVKPTADEQKSVASFA